MVSFVDHSSSKLQDFKVSAHLAVRHLCFDYSDKPLLREINFSLSNGKALHIKGRNGAGKSTLLKLLASLLRPSEGVVLFNDQPIFDQIKPYRASMHYLGHLDGIHPLLTPAEYWQYELGAVDNCLKSMDPADKPREVGCGMNCQQLISMQSFQDAMTRLGLLGNENKPYTFLSAGQQRRMGLMRLLAREANVWLLDEPWVALDEQASLILKQLIEQHLHRGGIAIITSHQPLPLDKTFIQEYCL